MDHDRKLSAAGGGVTQAFAIARIRLQSGTLLTRLPDFSPRSFIQGRKFAPFYGLGLQTIEEVGIVYQ